MVLPEASIKPSEWEILFDESKHEYTVFGEKVDNVTSIMRELGISKRPHNATEFHRTKGSLVHQGTLLADLGRWSRSETSPELIPPIEAYIAFRKKIGFEPHLVEHPVYSPIFHIAGHLDRWGFVGDESWLIELKTGNMDPAHTIQVSLYAILLQHQHGLKSDIRAVVMLGDNGAWRIHKATTRDHAVALSAANVWHWRQSNNRIERRN